MKRIVIILFAILTVGSFSCDKLKDLASFEHELSVNIDFTENSQAGIAEVTSESIAPDIQAELDANGLDASNIKANLIGFTATIESPADKTFGDLASVEFFITDGTNETKIAWKDAIDTNVGNTLSLDIDDSVDLFSYLESETVAFIAKYDVINAIDEDYTVNLKANFKIGAK